MQYFYDGQVRRYLTQIVRAFSNYSYKNGDGEIIRVPVMYGDITRQVASIIKDNSDNKVLSAPRMGIYITSLQMDRSRLSDSSYVSKINLRERDFDEETQSYLVNQTKGVTVERLHPTPYTLSVNVDLWSTSTDQKLQIMEQILMLFNPDLEFQTTDNYVDWTSLSVLQMENINFSSRTIPMGAGDDIDVATMGLTAPIYISPPVKVKKLGIITDIITSIFNSEQGTISLEGFNPPTDGALFAADGVTVLPDGSIVNEGSAGLTSTVLSGNGRLDLNNPLVASYRNFDLLIDDATGSLVKNGKLRVGEIDWQSVIEAELPAKFQPGISQLRLRRAELTNPIVGTFNIKTNDSFTIEIDYDEDTLPANTIITGPSKTAGTVDGIINPLSFVPIKNVGQRYLILQPIGYKVERSFVATTSSNRIDTEVDYLVAETVSGSIPNRRADTVTDFTVFVDGLEVSGTKSNIDGKFVINLDAAYPIGSTVTYILNLNEQGPTGWQNTDGSDLLADANDILEWSGSKWINIFDASQNSEKVYITNLFSGEQIYWNNYYWQSSVDGYYPRGTWEIIL
jgi:hypothetical protein